MTIPCHVESSTTSSRFFTSVIFCAGKCSGNPGKGASAIAVFRAPAEQVENAAVHHLATTVNAADLIALIGGMTAAESTPGETAVVSSSSLAVEIATGMTSVTDIRLRDLATMAVAVWTRVQPRVSLHRIARTAPNAAGSICSTAARTRTNSGRADIFPPSPFFGLPPITHDTTSENVPRRQLTADLIEGVSTFEDFTKLPRLHARTAPRNDWPRLARLAHQLLSQALVADVETSSKAFLRFLALPSRILRCKRPPDRIQEQRKPDARESAIRAQGLDPGAVRRCERFADDGLLSRALNALDNTTVADLSIPEVRVCAQSKFPARKEEIAPLPAIEYAAFTAESIQKALRDMPNGAASAFSGWSKELLTAATTVDNSVADLLAQVVNRVSRGEYNELATRCVMATRFVGLEKPGRNPAEDLRPICIGDLIYKLLGACASSAAQLPLPSWQLGCGASRGVERAIGKIASELASGAFALTPDVKNAHNEIKRSSIANALLEAGPTAAPLLAFFKTCDTQPREVLALTRKGNFPIIMEEGCQQGCSSASKLFCLAFGTAIDKSRAAASVASLVGIQDDLTASDPNGENCMRFLRATIPRLAEIGLQLNLNKCELLHKGPIPPHIVEDAASLGLKCFDTTCDTARILGRPFGPQEGIDAHCDKLLDKETRRLAHLKYLHPQLAYTMLRLCGLPFWRFLARTTPGIEDRSRLFDTLIRESFRDIIKCEPERQWVESTAGAGLYSYEATGAALYEENRVACAEIEASGAHTRPPKSATETFNENLRKTHPELDDADATSSCGNHSTLWMKWSTHKAARMTKQDFVDAMRLRCRCAITPARLTCFCGEPLDVNHTASKHILRCGFVNGITWQHRHDGVVAVLQRAVAASGTHAVTNPTFYNYADGSAKKPDITAFFPGDPISVDVTIVTPEASAGAAAKKAAAEKKEKHSAAVNDKGHDFIPLAFETWGHSDPSYDIFARRLSNACQPWAAKNIVEELKIGVATAIAAGNARIVRGAVERLRTSNSFVFASPSTL